MNYITSQEAAAKWGLTRRSVQLYCQNGRIPGAINPGKQWLIPQDAEKPQDTRFAENKKAQELEVYHFPLFVYSRCFLAISELSEDERFLREAQILNISGEFPESVRICRKLIDDQASPAVRFGAWFTNYSNYMLLGLASRMSDCMNAMEQICSTATAHKEDYRLLIAFLDYNYRFDSTRYMQIKVTKLSPDAITTFNLMALTVAYFSVGEVQDSSIMIYESACRETELLGIAPASLTMHSLIALLHSRKGNLDEKLNHIYQSCRIGYENGYVRLLAKCSSLDIDAYVQCLSNYDKAFASKLHERCLRFRSNWQLAYKLHSGSNPAVDVNIFEAEIVLLLVYKIPIEDIAMLKNVSEKKVRKTIKALCTRLSLKSKKELVELFTATYCSAPGAKPRMSMAAAAENAEPGEKTE